MAASFVTAVGSDEPLSERVIDDEATILREELELLQAGVTGNTCANLMLVTASAQ